LQGNEDEGSILEFAFSAPIVRVRGVRIEQGDSVFESSAICRELVIVPRIRHAAGGQLIFFERLVNGHTVAIVGGAVKFRS
jgi:hypothetical protein